MEKSTPNLDIKVHGFYAYVKGLEKGLGLVVFDKTDKMISGVKLCVGKTESFQMTKSEFENLIAYGMIEFVESLPKHVWKDLQKSYTK